MVAVFSDKKSDESLMQFNDTLALIIILNHLYQRRLYK